MLEKMSRSVLSMLLILMCAVVCQISADSYSQLDTKRQRFVDLTITKANQQFNGFGHLNFFEFGTVKEVSSRVKMDVRLKNTHCRKDARRHTHRPECVFKQLQVWCVVCSPDVDTNTPFIGCVRRADAKKLEPMIEEHCGLHGAASALARTDGDGVQSGCLGCF